jgi:hypothetical protein
VAGRASQAPPKEVSTVALLSGVIGGVVASLVDLNHTGHYVHWGFIQISVANLVLIGLMVVVFAAAILIPFKRPGRRRP